MAWPGCAGRPLVSTQKPCIHQADSPGVFLAPARPGSPQPRPHTAPTRPIAPSRLLLISNFARSQVRHLRPRRFVVLRTFAWQLPHGRRSTISYTQQIYFYSNSYGIVG
jgi:transposase